ncbi:MAG: sulfatase-like hydrolase/transferase, partial [Muribaculaceae bacterium]|nr:sulfatase-like hydrolase/transferase [Muribaculaceae bacterium]
TFTVVMALWKVVFMALHMSDLLGSVWQVALHGLAMDMSVAGYLSVIPGLLIAAETATAARWPRVALSWYLGLVSALLGGIFCLDLLLYGYWGFRLDMTPLFYFSTSPSAAMASARWWEVAAGLAAWGAAALLTWLALSRGAAKIHPGPAVRRRWAAPAVMVAATGLLFIPIRGSFTVSTMNLSRSYFSRDIRLNHAATNPAFSLLYSATHQSDFGSQFQYYKPREAERLMAELLGPTEVADSAAAPPCGRLLRGDRPDVVLVILESFSSHLMPSLGGDSVAVGLDSLGREGVLFSNILASSFRTDRGVPAILSAFPGPPTVSVMKYVDKIEHLPSLPRVMRDKGGYRLAYYYGGDANFFNMMAYLM